MSDAFQPSAEPARVFGRKAAAAPDPLSESGFDALYTSRIEPELEARELDREGAVRAFWLRLGLGIVATGILAGVCWAWLDGRPGGSRQFVRLIQLIALGLAGSAWLAWRPLKRVGQETKRDVLSTLCQPMGVTYAPDRFDPPAFDRFGEMDLVASCDIRSFEDLFQGRRDDCGFALYEARLQRRSGKSTVTVFRGQLIRIAFPKPFLGTTVVLRDAGMFNGVRMRSLQKVGLGDAGFEKLFEVYGSDQVEARYLVHPAFMQKLLDLESAYKGCKLRCAFQSGDLLIAVEGRDMFEIGDLFENLVNRQRAKQLDDDLGRVLGLIDAVLAGPPPAYPSGRSIPAG